MKASKRILLCLCVASTFFSTASSCTKDELELGMSAIILGGYVVDEIVSNRGDNNSSSGGGETSDSWGTV